MVKSATLTTRAAPYEVNTFDADGDAVLHIGDFDSITSARNGIVAHAGAELDITTYGAFVLPSIAESWIVAGKEYVVHCADPRSPDLETVMEAEKPALIARYTTVVTRSFDAMIKMHGPGLRGIANCWAFAKTFRQTVAPYVTSDRTAINADALADGAAEYADAVISEWLAKIRAKMGEMTDPKVSSLGDCTFLITGRRGNSDVSIRQTCILNVSKLGRPFNQFPARITVDGKAVSEASYARAA